MVDSVGKSHGNILDMKAYKVGREFVTIMLVEVEPSMKDQITQSLCKFNGKGVRVALQDTQPWLSDEDLPRCKNGVTYTGHLYATGIDKPGLLLRLTEALTDFNLDITSIHCNQHYQTAIGALAAPCHVPRA